MRNAHVRGADHKAQEDGALQFKIPDEVEEAGCGNHGQVFRGKIKSNRGGGYGTHQGDGGVQIPQAAVGPVRRRLFSSTLQHHGGKAGVGAAWKVTMEGGGGAGSLGKVLPRGISVGALVWRKYMGNFGTNDAEVRGSAYGFPAESHRKTGNTQEGWVLAAGDGKSSSTGSGDTAAPDIYGKVTGNSVRVVGPVAYF